MAAGDDLAAAGLDLEAGERAGPRVARHTQGFAL
jgi:hypothetical protein